MRSEITDLTRITEQLDPTGAIETYIWDEITESKWEDVSDIVAQLESAACNAGSWSGMIYTRDILEKLSDPQWVQDIEDCVSEYEGETGETPNFDPYGSGFSLSATVTFAVDWVAYRLASRLRSFGKVATVTVASDSCDPFPDRIAFASEWEAIDWVSEELERRVSHRVAHSTYPVTEEDLAAWQQEESQLIIIEEDRL